MGLVQLTAQKLFKEPLERRTSYLQRLEAKQPREAKQLRRALDRMDQRAKEAKAKTAK